MSSTLPRLHQGLLHDPTRDQPIMVGTPAWYAWLADNQSFRITLTHGTITVRKEWNKSGSAYWKAYRRFGKHVRNKYIGTSDKLTVDQIRTIISALDPAHQPQQTTTTDQPGFLAVVDGRLSPPIAQPTWIARPELQHLIEQSSEVRLIAPAGYGKTSLLAQYAASSTRTIAWLTLDHADNDPDRLARMLIGSIQHAVPELADHALALLDQHDREAPVRASQHLLRTLRRLVRQSNHTVQFCWILDDCDRLFNPAAIRLVNLLSHPRQDGLHVILASRQPLSPLFKRSRSMVVLDTRQLSLNPSERQHVSAWDQIVCIPALRAWVHTSPQLPIGLVRLAQYALDQGLDPQDVIDACASQRIGVLLGKLIAHGAPPAQKFMQIASLMRWFRLENLAELLDQPLDHANDLLPMLAPAGLVMPFMLPDWYELPRWYAEQASLSLAQTNPSLYQAHLQRIMHWFDLHGCIPEAIDAALLGEHWNYAGQHIASLTIHLRQHCEWELLRYWLYRLPPAVIDQYPELMQSELALYTAQIAYEINLPPAAASQHYRSPHTLADVVEQFQTIADRSGAINNPLVRIDALISAAHLSRLQGKFEQALAYCAQVEQISLVHNQRPPLIDCAIELCRSAIIYEQNDLATAAVQIERTYRQAIHERQPIAVMWACIAIVSLKLAQGDWPAALHELGKALPILEQTGIPWSQELVEALQALIATTTSEPEPVLRWLQRIERPSGIEPIPIMLERPFALATVRSLIMLKRYGTAQALLQRLYKQASIYGQRDLQILFLALQAVVLVHTDNQSAAQYTLKQALLIAGSQPYWRSLLDADPLIGELLRDLSDSRGLHMPATPQSSVVDNPVETLRLTQLDLRILPLLSSSLPRQAIATNLDMGLSAFQAALSRLYRRLNVRSRHEAVTRARELGILVSAT